MITPKHLRADVLNALDFGAAGDGVIDDTAALIAMFDAASTRNKTWYLPGGSYLVSGAVTAYTAGVCDGEIICANAAQAWAAFNVAPRAADVLTIPVATVNAWTGLVANIAVSADWSAYFGYTIILYSNDQIIINRRNSTFLRYTESFVVYDPDGSIYPPIAYTKAATFTAPNTVCYAVRNAEKIIIHTPKVRFLTGAGEAVVAIYVTRPNTVLDAPSVINQSGAAVSLGVSVNYCSGVEIRDGYVEGLRDNVTNYGYSTLNSVGTTLTDCTEVYCRRGTDMHFAREVVVRGGSYPDGIGGHWVQNVAVNGAYVASGASNTSPLFFSGYGVKATGCRIRLNNDQLSVFSVRQDLFSFGGPVILDNNDIDIFVGANTTSVRQIININPGTSATFDYGTQLLMPAHIQITNNRIRQIGATFTGNLYCVNLLNGGGTTTPLGIYAGGKIIIRDNSWVLDAGVLNAGDARIWAVLIQKILAYIAGSGYEIILDGLPSARVWLWCDPAHSALSSFRATIVARNIEYYYPQGGYGAYLSHDVVGTTLQNAFGLNRPTGGHATPIGDETEIWKTLTEIKTASPLSLGEALSYTAFPATQAIRTESSTDKYGLIIESGDPGFGGLIVWARSGTITGDVARISGVDAAGYNLLNVLDTEAADGSGAISRFRLAAGGEAYLGTGNMVFSAAGKGIQLKSGTGARAGDAVLVAGTVTVSNTTVTTNTKVFLTRKVAGGTLGMALTYTISAGSGFTIDSDNALDTSTITFMLVELNA